MGERCECGLEATLWIGARPYPYRRWIGARLRTGTSPIRPYSPCLAASDQSADLSVRPQALLDSCCRVWIGGARHTDHDEYADGFVSRLWLGGRRGADGGCRDGTCPRPRPYDPLPIPTGPTVRGGVGQEFSSSLVPGTERYRCGEALWKYRIGFDYRRGMDKISQQTVCDQLESESCLRLSHRSSISRFPGKRIVETERRNPTNAYPIDVNPAHG